MVCLFTCLVALTLAIFFLSAALRNQHESIAILFWAPAVAMLVTGLAMGVKAWSLRSTDKETDA